MFREPGSRQPVLTRQEKDKYLADRPVIVRTYKGTQAEAATTGSAQARINSLDRRATQSSIGLAYGRPTRFHPRKPRSFKLKRARRPQRSNLTNPKPAAKSP
jgi:hypothetical protein